MDFHLKTVVLFLSWFYNLWFAIVLIFYYNGFGYLYIFVTSD